MILKNIAEIRDLTGSEVGTSNYLSIDQRLLDSFANVAGDTQWIHTDPERCKSEVPGGTTIAHGYLILALSPRFFKEILVIQAPHRIVNCGLNKVRFINPLPVNSLLRMRLTILSVQQAKTGTYSAGLRVGVKYTFEREGFEKPVAIAEVILLLIPS